MSRIGKCWRCGKYTSGLNNAGECDECVEKYAYEKLPQWHKIDEQKGKKDE